MSEAAEPGAPAGAPAGAAVAGWITVSYCLADPLLCLVAILAVSHLIAMGKLDGRAFLEVMTVVGVWLGNLYRRSPLDRGPGPQGAS